VRGLISLSAAAIALAVFAPAGSSSSSAARYRVVSAKGTATLTFHTQTADLNSISNGTVKLSVAPKRTGRGTVPGRVTFPLKGTLTERVKTKARDSDTSPYQEQTCANTGTVSGRGGLRFRSVRGKIEARWLLPQANPRFCSGPRVGSAITAKMTRLYPPSKFSAGTATVVVNGTKKTHSGSADLTYRCRLTVKLARS
jgi:hypothetical protein